MQEDPEDEPLTELAPEPSTVTQASDERPVMYAVAASGTKRRRLSQKSSPARAAELGYIGPPPQPERVTNLITQAAAAAARTRARGLLIAHRRRAKSARNAAWDSFFRQPEQSNAASEAYASSEDTGVLGATFAIPAGCNAHASHDAKAPMGAELLFCKRCGAWSSGQRSRGLVAQCRGRGGHRGNLRLLHLGVALVRGARVPREHKDPGAKGTRGGSATRGKRGRRGGRSS